MKENNMKSRLLACLLVLAPSIASAQSTPEAGKPATTTPTAATPAIVSWPEFSGYKRYHGNCAVCHGPDGLGGTFAPSLVNSLKAIDHDAFLDVVVNGKENAQLAMPSFGADPNVMCYIEDIYIYLKARSESRIARGRPVPQPTKPSDVADAETACMGG